MYMEMEVRKAIIPAWKCHENEEKIDNDRILRNDYRIKITQPISMILVSFCSEDGVLDLVKLKYAIFSNIKVLNKNWAFHFFWDTRCKKQPFKQCWLYENSIFASLCTVGS